MPRTTPIRSPMGWFIWVLNSSLTNLVFLYMSTSISTSTRQPTNENRIDLEGSQTVINKARQLPLHVVAFKDAFTEATQDIARIAENANPEDPDLLNVEIAAIKVRRVHQRCSKSSRASSVFCAFCWGALSRVRMAIKCVGKS